MDEGLIASPRSAKEGSTWEGGASRPAMLTYGSDRAPREEMARTVGFMYPHDKKPNQGMEQTARTSRSVLGQMGEVAAGRSV